MFKSMQRNWATLILAVKVTATVLAIVSFTWAMSPEINHGALTAQPAAATGAGIDVADKGPAEHAEDTNCHAGHNCMNLFLPTVDLTVTRHDGDPPLIRVADYSASVADDIPFHPPRTRSLG